MSGAIPNSWDVSRFRAPDRDSYCLLHGRNWYIVSVSARRQESRVLRTGIVAMILAGPIMRSLGVPILGIVGWLLSALQAGLAVHEIIAALRRLHIVP
jgi:hypothetical protein